MYIFALGLVKKVVLADAFSRGADYAFTNISSMSAFEAWTGAAAYALQIYFDFSGYSDMAIASALLFGVEIPRNFDAPLRATSIIEYWQRWHISLTSFITTYLYTPILRSFSRVTLFTSALATLAAMSIAGLWHGPNWTFVIFGASHGVALAVNQYWRKKKMPSIPDPLSWLMTFVVFEIGFVFLRAPNLHVALLFVQTLFSWHAPFITGNFHKLIGLSIVGATSIVFLLVQAVGIVVVIFAKSSDQLAHQFKPSTLTYATAVACALIAFLYLNSNVVKPFVYFAF
jgi:D-alanyl-lipoteichoic acid acyltransferase DltB (MBOAT superfamily)